MKTSLRGAILAAGLAWLATPPSSSAQLTITNSSLRVDYNTSSGQFSVTSLPSQRLFVPNGQFTFTNGSAFVQPVTNAIFGAGQDIVIIYSGGNRNDILLFTNLPFAVFQSSISNSAATNAIFHSFNTAVMQEDIGEPLTNQTVMGTSGLQSASANSTSYEWLVVADPTNRNGVVNGWISDDRGSGMVNGSVSNLLPSITAHLDYGQLGIAAGQSAPLEMFAVGYFDDARIGLETWASTIAQVYNIHLPPQPSGYCTFQGSPYGGPGTAYSDAQVADFAKTNLAPFGFSVIQIDGRWEAGVVPSNGPPRDFTQSNPTNGNYPNGMKPTADYEKAEGLTPGIWLEPFSGTSFDPIFTNHLDWFVKSNANGGVFTTPFGGSSLDMTYEPAREYVSNIIYTITHVWGYQYLKMDGLYAGAGVIGNNISAARFSDTNKPNVEVFRDGLRLVRAAAGTNVFLNGCNLGQSLRVYGGSFGLVDGMRVGNDDGPSNWDTWRLHAPIFGSLHYFLHGRVWYNDPDMAYVRDTYPLNEAQTIASWYAVSGQLLLDSDWPLTLSSGRVDMLKRMLPPHGLLPRPVDYLENYPPLVWLLTDTRHRPRRDVIAAFNWLEYTNEIINMPLSHIGLPGTTYVAYEFWSNVLITNLSGSLQLNLPAASCAVLAVRPVSTRPQVISTSRHITQGIVDVLSETWAEAGSTLNGQSQLVGQDPYELRIVVPSGSPAWLANSAAVSAADQTAGVTISYVQTDNLVRVSISTPVSRVVSWSVGFSGPPPVPPPAITRAVQSGNQLIVNGSRGIASGQYYVLASTNAALPQNSWTIVATNNFDGSGNFTFTNILDTTAQATFYEVALP